MRQASSLQVESAPPPRRGVLQSIVLGTARGPVAARVLEGVFYALVIAALAGACLAVGVVAASPRADALQQAALVGAVIVAGGVMVSLCARIAELFGQRARDLTADAIFRAVREGRPAPAYSLYLRPFVSTDSIEDYGAAIAVPGAGLALGGERFELEAQVERATRGLGRLIGLGGQVEHIGAGRVTVGEQEWRDAIRTLMQNSRIIVILPGARQGTLEEIDMVLGGDLVRKTVFLDPPNLGRNKRFDHAGEWEKVRAAFAAKGFDLPAEDRRGALLFYGREKKPALRERLHIDADDHIERLFRRVIKMLKTQGA